MRILVVDSVYKLMDRFESELEGLYEDLKELAGNRKYSFLEAEAILTADSFLDFIIERLSGFVIRPDIPDDLVERAENLLQYAYEVRDFIYANFQDVYRERHRYNFKVG